MLSSGEDD